MLVTVYLPLSYSRTYVVSKQFMIDNNVTEAITYRGVAIYRVNLSTLSYHAMGVNDPYDIITLGY